MYIFNKILLSVLLTNFIIRCCDNSPEFKASVAELAQQLSIYIIRSRPYHPQTQGSVEVANKTFKRRLRALLSRLNMSRLTVLSDIITRVR
jgi:hypothetical protein